MAIIITDPKKYNAMLEKPALEKAGWTLPSLDKAKEHVKYIGNAIKSSADDMLTALMPEDTEQGVDVLKLLSLGGLIDKLDPHGLSGMVPALNITKGATSKATSRQLSNLIELSNEQDKLFPRIGDVTKNVSATLVDRLPNAAIASQSNDPRLIKLSDIIFKGNDNLIGRSTFHEKIHDLYKNDPSQLTKRLLDNKIWPIVPDYIKSKLLSEYINQGFSKEARLAKAPGEFGAILGEGILDPRNSRTSWWRDQIGGWDKVFENVLQDPNISLVDLWQKYPNIGW